MAEKSAGGEDEAFLSAGCPEFVLISDVSEHRSSHRHCHHDCGPLESPGDGGEHQEARVTTIWHDTQQARLEPQRPAGGHDENRDDGDLPFVKTAGQSSGDEGHSNRSCHDGCDDDGQLAGVKVPKMDSLVLIEHLVRPERYLDRQTGQDYVAE